MATKRTRSPAPADLGISAEVAWYLESRGIPLPDCPPKVQTPSPGEAPGAVFDPERVDRVLRSFHLLRHTQGKWAGKPLDPDPWQVAYILAPVFGWVRWDDEAEGYVRIVRKLYVDVPRRNGKTTLSGGIAVYLMAADGEPGAQVYAAATSEKQARYTFDPIKTIAERAPALKGNVKAYTKKITHPASGSYFTVVSSVAEALHGANVHGGIIDELHVHKSPDLVETIETGTGSRRQPLVVIITTADEGKQESIYDRRRQYVEQLARGALHDPDTYGVVWGADESDDPFAVETQRKANPGYGVSPSAAYLKGAAAEAQQSPADLAKYLRLHLGIRTKQSTRFLRLEDWDANAGLVDEAALAGRDAYGGLDLASTSDLCALCWLFPDDATGTLDAVFRFWTPEDNLRALDKRTAGAASRWVREGFLVATPGNVCDYDFIREQVRRDRDAFKVRSIGYDPWNASQLTNDLVSERAPMVKVRQGFATMSPVLKEIQRLVLQGTPEAPALRHGGHPVTRWCVDNLAVTMDPAGNVKPDKANSGDKIDGVSALATAMAEVVARPPRRKSRYADEDEIMVV
ncbi:terminase [Streptomyces rimosus subsp. rimosus]|uniref:Terminase large subunit n=3 Tax=Streptomyces TaxID=1883 RepID=A0A8A1UMC0_STRR1|nr:terminase [Streptomyces rimosus]KOG70520.1 terminase [Kitasatospora aureofaciens]KOT31347.1 terminase [Streptomyces sp. NRRL WC-3701]KOT32206.1 terminase [Streptomyces rimosus subsp. rimosus]KUJ70396.1 terminase [Streptomyces albus subsp. albus]MYT47296.1 terminase large subunit [Streptomyces sp. SID5471]QGY64750.1 terminase large subunit [Streptomyces rimosus R6-500]QST81683.1 terminase large subunit [Streptomyces rimosus subsp. rimosus ATCC 10970]